MKTTVVKGVLTSYELVLAILFRWRARSCVRHIVWLWRSHVSGHRSDHQSLSDNSNFPVGNASTAFEHECYEIEDDTPQFYYHGPKIKIPKQGLPMTICTSDTIGTIRSWGLFQVLFDSGSNVSTIKRSALPKGVIKTWIGDTKLVRILTGCLKRQEVVTKWDISLPEFDKNRRINQQKSISVWQQQRQIRHHPGFFPRLE